MTARSTSIPSGNPIPSHPPSTSTSTSFSTPTPTSTSTSDDPKSGSRPPSLPGLHTFHLITPPDNATITPMSSFHTLDTGLNELVSKLQALQAHENHDENHDLITPVLEPLPPNATCPGAPKIPAVFTMPLFAPDDDCEANENHAPYPLKRPNSRHMMSPLAEVTEAYTGLQGGWSPPLETRSPMLETYSFHTVAIPTATVPAGPPKSIVSDHDPPQGKALGISFYMEKLTPGPKRRREPTFPAMSSSNQSPSLATKGPLRI